MGFKLVGRVYELGKDLTSPSEQAVLLALAFCANDKTGLCYPKQETLAQMTHMSRATVANALNALREIGLIQWKSGGLANRKGKFGKTLSNDYTLTLPPGGKEARPGVQQSDTPVSSSQTRQCPAVRHTSVQQSDTPVSSSKTHQCPAVRHTSVQQLDTGVSSSKTPTEINNNHKNSDTNRRTPAAASGLDGLARDLGAGLSASRAVEANVVENSPLLTALAICGFAPGTPEYRGNYRAFSSVMMKIGMERSMEIVRAIASEQRQGELGGIQCLPRFIMSRLQTA